MSQHNKMAPKEQWKWNGLCENRNMFGSGIDYVGGATCWSSNSLQISVIAPWSLASNKPVNPEPCY